MADVIVIGGGLAGTLCALELRRLGLRVDVARSGWGATALFAGPVELGASPALASPIMQPHARAADAHGALGWSQRRHIEDIAAHRAQHPFALLGAQRTCQLLEQGGALLASALAPSGLKLPQPALDAPLGLYPGVGGILRPGAGQLSASGAESALMWGCRAQAAAVKGALWGVLDLADFGAPLGPRALAGWRFDAGRMGSDAMGPGRLVSLRVTQDPQSALAAGPIEPFASALSLARHLDDLEAAAVLARRVVPLLPPELRGLLVPPVLGLGKHAEIHALWQQMLGVPVVEAAAALPSVAGVRLMLALEAARREADIGEIAGPIVRLRSEGEQVRAAMTACGEHFAEGFVLASGRFLGGGLQWTKGERALERTCGLPLVGDEGPVTERLAMDVTCRRPYAPQPLSRIGVAVADSSMQVLTPQMTPMPNLWATGLIQAGFAPHEERSSDGVAIATAMACAQDIAQRISVSHRAPMAPREA